MGLLIQLLPFTRLGTSVQIGTIHGVLQERVITLRGR